MNKDNSNNAQGSQFSRRQFLTSASMALGAVTLLGCKTPTKLTGFPYVGRVLGANDRINIACIGVGGKGSSDIDEAVHCGGHVIGLCDVDQKILKGKAENLSKKFDNIQQFADYRVMLEKMGKDIDAVTISTPDHVHGSAAVMAMRMGKHCFCQKPLVQTISEARMIREIAREKKLATQMGNQGSAEDGLRRAVEVVHAGVIGKPLELHVWSNRPIWPQGMARPQGSDPIPDTLNWDLWLGPAPYRPYKKDTYHTFKWRGFTDFGTGALGDMACHTVNMPFRALKLGYPNVVECEMASRIYAGSYPKTSRIRFEFPEREGLPKLKFWWYDGNPGDDSMSPIRPGAEVAREIIAMQDKLPGSGALIVGEKGKIFSPDDYGAKFYVLTKGDEEFVAADQHPACKAVAQTLPRAPRQGERVGVGVRHMQEWFDMMRGGPAAYSNFEIAGYLAEVILLGCLAQQMGEGERIEWDGPNMTSPNNPSAQRFVHRSPRFGWKV